MSAIQIPDHLRFQPTPQGGVIVLNSRTGQWHALNTTAGLLWQNWSDGAGFEQSVAALARLHPEVPTELLREDAGRLLGALIERGLVRADLMSGGTAAMTEQPRTSVERPGRMLCVVAFTCLLAAGLVGRLPFRMLHAAVRATKWWCRTEPSLATATKVVNAVDHVALYYPGRAACMEKSLAAVVMAALIGRRIDWCLGAVPDPYRFHAWVEIAGREISGPQDRADIVSYVRILAV